MEYSSQVYFASNRSQDYVEIQAQASSSEGSESFGSIEPALLVGHILVNALPVLILLGLSWLYLSGSNKRSRKVLETADKNTAAIEANSELLRENVQLQKELLEELRKRSSSP